MVGEIRERRGKREKTAVREEEAVEGKGRRRRLWKEMERREKLS